MATLQRAMLENTYREMCNEPDADSAENLVRRPPGLGPSQPGPSLAPAPARQIAAWPPAPCSLAPSLASA